MILMVIGAKLSIKMNIPNITLSLLRLKVYSLRILNSATVGFRQHL
jgi:hypothetical protein